MKKLFYTLMMLLALYICFYGIRFYKERTDSAFVSQLVNTLESLYEKKNKISNIINYYEHKISDLERKKKEQNQDDNITSLNTDNTAYQDLKMQAESGLITLQTKIKELDHYITKCNKGFISRKLRKETNEHLKKYFDNEAALDTIVSNVESDFTKIKETQQKAKEEKQKNEQKDSGNETVKK